jgi:hypothetical protein
MGAMKKLYTEYKHSGRSLTGFPAQHRADWRRLLPPGPGEPPPPPPPPEPAKPRQIRLFEP